MPTRLADRLGRAAATLYPRASSAARSDLAGFIAAAADDAWRRRRWRGVPALAADLATDITRSWLGRSALPISARTHITHAHGPRRSTAMDRWSSDLRYALRVLARTP